MKVALLGNLEQSAVTQSEMSPDRQANRGSWDTIQAITISLEKAGHQVVFLEGDETLYNNLQAVKPDICFNTCNGYSGNSPEAQIPAILELLGIPYTGSRVLTLALAHNEAMTRRVLAHQALPTPAFQIFRHENEPLDPNMQFPVVINLKRKKNAGLILHDERQLRAQLRSIFEQIAQPVTVENVIEGRGLTIGIVGNLENIRAAHIIEDGGSQPIFQNLHVFPPVEINANAFGDTPPDIKQTKAKVVDNPQYARPASLDKNLIEELNRLAVTTFDLMGCLDVTQVDFRFDANDHNKPYILAVNPLPDLNPNHSSLCFEATTAGWSYGDLINRILDEAVQRQHIHTPVLSWLEERS